MKKIQTKSLFEVCLKITDGSHFSPLSSEGGYLMASSKDMNENGWNYSDIKQISKNDYLKLVKSDCKPRLNDVLIIKDGNSYLQKVFAVKREEDIVILSSIAILRPDVSIVNPFYLQYLLRTSYIKDAAANFVTGAAIPRVILSDFKKVKIPYFPIATQQSIASILSAYDDLIEVNNQRIKLLEETARELYKEWFVRMRFPGYKNVKFVKGVPEGWEVKKIGDVCKVARGSSPRPIVDTKYFENGTIPWVKIADASASGKFLFETKEYVNEFGASFSRLLKPGSLIIATSGTLGFCIFLAIEACIHDGWMYTTDYKYSVTPEFLFFVINDRTEYFNNLSYGAAIQNINTDILRKAPFLLPDKDLLEKFQGIIVPINENQKNLQQQNTQLRQIRDRLLPRLISGKLVVITDSNIKHSETA